MRCEWLWLRGGTGRTAREGVAGYEDGGGIEKDRQDRSEGDQGTDCEGHPKKPKPGSRWYTEYESDTLLPTATPPESPSLES